MTIYFLGVTIHKMFGTNYKLTWNYLLCRWELVRITLLDKVRSDVDIDQIIKWIKKLGGINNGEDVL